MRKLFLLLLLLPVGMFAQFSTVATAIVNGTGLPATCSPLQGKVFFVKAGAGVGATGTPYYCSAVNTWTSMSGSGGSPGGSNTQLQYNNSSSFGGVSDLTYVSHTLTLGASGILNVSAGKIVLPSSIAGSGISVNTVGGTSVLTFDSAVLAGTYFALAGNNAITASSGANICTPSASLACLVLIPTAIPSSPAAGSLNVDASGWFAWNPDANSGHWKYAVAAASAQDLTLLSTGIMKVTTTTGAVSSVATTGSGSVVLATSPMLVTPALGTPTALVLTNATGLPSTSVLPTTLATGTSVSLPSTREYYVCTSTCTVTPPVPAAGSGEFCVRNTNNVSTVITLAAIGSSARYETQAKTGYGTAGTGTFVSGGAIGDQVCLVGLDSTHYLIWSINGTWTAN